MIFYEASEGDAKVLTPDSDLAGPEECGALNQKLAVTIGQGARRLVLDLCHVRQLSGPALRALLLASRKLDRKNGRLVLCGLTESVARIVAISGLEPNFAVAATLQEAIGDGSVAPPPPGTAHEEPVDPLAGLAECICQILAKVPGAALPASAAVDEPFAALVLDTLANRGA